MCTKVWALMGVGAVGGLGGWSGNWCSASGPLHSHTYIMSQPIAGNLAGMPGSGHLTITGC